jgi:hypothetical protein
MTDPWKQRLIDFGFATAPEPPKPGRPPAIAGDNPAYAEAALRDEAKLVANAAEGTRNDTLNTAAFNLGSFVVAGALDRDTVIDTLTWAARTAGLAEIEIRNTIASGFAGSAAKVGAREVPAERIDVAEATPGSLNGSLNGHAPTPAALPGGRVITWRRGTEVKTALPDWAWSYGGRGRIQLGTLALLAGRPAAGKSTAARWFAAQATLGKLEGCWDGHPQHVAYIASEESQRYTIAPGLIAAGADMSRIHFPEVTRDGQAVALLSTLDEIALLEYLAENHITIVIVDPLMSTVTSTTDINKNNETRAQIAPWARIAEAINGVTLGVVHLRKNASGDVVAAITGSSAFGEIARSVFGFAKNIENDTRVMSQHKNSTGYEDLSLTYEIASVPVHLSDGRIGEIGAFHITGESEVTVEDILSDSAMHNGGVALECQRWLSDYLNVEGPCRSRAVKAEAQKEGFSTTTVDRAARKLKVVVESKDFPRVTYWAMPVTSSHVTDSS